MEKNIHLETYIYEHTYTHIYLHIYIYLYASYFHLGNKITFNFGLFFENVQIRTKLLKKVSRALKITEKKNYYVTTSISYDPTILVTFA